MARIRSRSIRPLSLLPAFLSALIILALAFSGCSSTTTGNSTPPTVTISANPTSVNSGAASNLTVTASNDTSLSVTGSDGSSYTMQPAGGTQSVTPTMTTTYTATAIGTAGRITATTVVTVNSAPAPTVTITASPTSITAGNSSTLTVTATNATAVKVTGTDGSTYTLAITGGTQLVTPTTTTTYTATATGAAGTTPATATAVVTVSPVADITTVTMSANPPTVASGSSSTLTVTATNAAGVTVTGTDGSSYALQPNGGTQSVTPTTTTTYTATATGATGNATATATVTVVASGSLSAVTHVIFMLQENHTFDNYFGMLNPYRQSNNMNVGDDGVTYNVDGIDDKLTTTSNEDDEGTSYPLFPMASTCIDDMSSAWLESYGDVSRYNFTLGRPINMDGFVHDAEGYAKSCNAGGTCSGSFTDTTGQRAMGYYDQSFLNYYYYMASQFAVSDRWFSPVSSKSIDNRIATFTGGTTQGLVSDPGNDGFGQLNIPTIFQELQQNNVSWKIYYTVTQGFCTEEDDCPASGNSRYPATDFSSLSYSINYLYDNPSGATCTGTTQPSSVVGDASNSFCIDPNHIAPLSQYFTDLTNGTLAQFSFIEAGYGNNDEHPGSGQSILEGQAQVANILDSFMASSAWSNSIFFWSYDEGGGPYDHVPPVPGSSNQNTGASLGTIPDISSIAVNADSYYPCMPNGTPHCDLTSSDPGANSNDAPAIQGFAAQLGFRLPNMIISQWTRRHYVSHTPMDHTAIIKFVENQFINSSAHLTNRDAVQPNMLEFFDFTGDPWSKPPTPPAPFTDNGASCTPASFSAQLPVKK